MQLPIFRNRTYIRFTNLDSSLDNLKQIYSTDEKIVGTWVDGSKIYQKTFVNVMSVIDISNLKIETLIDIEAIATFDINSLASLNYNDGNYNGYIWLNTEKTQMTIRENNNKILHATVTLKYTKSP